MNVHSGSKENKVDLALIVFIADQLRNGVSLPEVKKKCTLRFSQMENDIIVITMDTALTMSKRSAVV